MYNNKDCIQDAAHAVISDWAQKHETKSMAYENIIASLQKCQMNQLASEVRQWAEVAAFKEDISQQSKFNFFLKNRTASFVM